MFYFCCDWNEVRNVTAPIISVASSKAFWAHNQERCHQHPTKTKLVVCDSHLNTEDEHRNTKGKNKCFDEYQSAISDNCDILI